jgi:hypothetical protein
VIRTIRGSLDRAGMVVSIVHRIRPRLVLSKDSSFLRLQTENGEPGCGFGSVGHTCQADGARLCCTMCRALNPWISLRTSPFFDQAPTRCSCVERAGQLSSAGVSCDERKRRSLPNSSQPAGCCGGILSDPVSPAAWPATHWPVGQAVEEGCSWEVGLRITPQGLCPGLAQ